MPCVLPCFIHCFYVPDRDCPTSYSRKQLYDIVADVDNYREFLPYCTDSVVHSSRLVKSAQPGGMKGVEKKRASLTVGFLAFKESYTSEVTCTPYSSVEVCILCICIRIAFYSNVRIIIGLSCWEWHSYFCGSSTGTRGCSMDRKSHDFTRSHRDFVVCVIFPT